MNIAVARIAAALAKTRAARAYDADEISADALALGQITRDAWAATLAQASITTLASEAELIAHRYNAELITDADPTLFVFGLRFRDGTYAGPVRNIFAML